MRGKWIWVIIGIGFLLRVMWLTRSPAGFTPDEASFGYDAYSILKTGKDQWGNTFPLVLKSFGDGKMPLYAYLTVPSVAVFGLNEFSVRLPNALLGSMAVLVVYLLVKEWRKNEQEALLAAFLLAVSPWHIPMSKGAFEANLTTFLMPLGIFLFLKGLKNRRLLALSMGVFGLNLFSYHSARLVTPLVVGFLVISNWKEVKNKVMPLGLFLGFLVLAGATYLGGAGARVGSVSIFSLVGSAGEERYLAVMAGTPEIIARIFNNKLTKLAELFGQNYLSYFSPSFLFTQGAREGTYGMLPGRGVLYLIELPFLITGVWILMKEKLKRNWWLVIWLVMAPIPAALAIGPGNAANRAVIMLPALQMVIAVGGVYLIKEVMKKRKELVWFLVLIYGVSFGFFLEDYFVQQPAQKAADMIYGSREVFGYLKETKNDYSGIIVSKSISEAHIYAAFFDEHSPDDYQKQVKNWRFDESGLTWVDQLPEYKLGEYTFKSIDRVFDLKRENYLLVGRPDEFGEDVNIMKKIYYPNKSEAYWIVSTEASGLAGK